MKSVFRFWLLGSSAVMVCLALSLSSCWRETYAPRVVTANRARLLVVLLFAYFDKHGQMPKEGARDAIDESYRECEALFPGSPREKLRDLFLDGWGRPFRVSDDQDLEVRIVSLGSNGLDDDGGGDDMVFWLDLRSGAYRELHKPK